MDAYRIHLKAALGEGWSLVSTGTVVRGSFSPLFSSGPQLATSIIIILYFICSSHMSKLCNELENM